MVDYKKIGIHVAIISKETNEIVAKGVLVAFKDLPVLSISFDFKYFFDIIINFTRISLKRNDVYYCIS